MAVVCRRGAQLGHMPAGRPGSHCRAVGELSEGDAVRVWQDCAQHLPVLGDSFTCFVQCYPVSAWAGLSEFIAHVCSLEPTEHMRFSPDFLADLCWSLGQNSFLMQVRLCLKCTHRACCVQVLFPRTFGTGPLLLDAHSSQPAIGAAGQQEPA